MITVLLADDHPMARAGLRALLAAADDLEIIGEAQDGFEVQELVPKLRPQILLLDLKMPGPRPAELEKWVRENYPETTTLILTAHDRDDYLASAMGAGAAGYLNKEESAKQLINAIRRVARGEVLFDKEQLIRTRQWREEVEDKLDRLTERERQILELLAKGCDNNAVAKELTITIKTTTYHITNLLKKLGLKSRQEAALWALKHLSDDPDESPG